MENDIKVTREGSVLTVVLGEELTRMNAPALMDEVSAYRDQGVDKVVFDATRLNFLSSSGVRVIIYCKKYMSDNTEIVFLNCSDKILDVLDIVGIRPFITFEKR
jgi:anti-sigma B factor antagonist